MHKMNDNGSAILLVLVILVSVAVLGVSVMNISSVESKMAGNFKAHEMTFNLTDGTMNAALPLISDAIDQNSPNSITNTGLLLQADAESFYYQLTGFANYTSTYDFDMAYGMDAGDDVPITSEVDVGIDVERYGAKGLPGYALEFAYGGSGFDSGMAIIYFITADGRGVQDSVSSIQSVYFKILGR